MLIGGILLGLIAGLLAGGSIGNLASIRLRWIALLFLAVVVRFSTEWAVEHDIVMNTLAARRSRIEESVGQDLAFTDSAIAGMTFSP